MEEMNGGNGEEVPGPRLWWEGALEIPLNLLLRIREQRADYNNPEYWRRLRREQREGEARQREEEANVVDEEEVNAGENNEVNVEENNEEEDGGQMNAEEEEEVAEFENDAEMEDEGVSLRGGPSDSEEVEDELNGGGDGIGTNDALELEVTEDELVTNKANGGDKMERQVEGGSLCGLMSAPEDSAMGKKDNDREVGLTEADVQLRNEQVVEGVNAGENNEVNVEENNEVNVEENNEEEDEQVNPEEEEEVVDQGVSSRGGRSDSEEVQDEINAGGDGSGASNALESEVTEDEQVTDKANGGDNIEEGLTGADIQSRNEQVGGQNVTASGVTEAKEGIGAKNGVQVLGGDHADFEEESQGTAQDNVEVNIRSKGQLVTQDDKIDQRNNVKVVIAPMKKKGTQVIIPAHISVITGDPPKYRCNFCQKSFKSKHHITYHSFCDQTKPKPFQCAVCDKSFISKSHYKNHLKLHNNQCPYKCIFCNQGFYLLNNFHGHLRSHVGERPFMCRECPKSFIQKLGLKVHTIQQHTGVSNFVCQICDQKFADRHRLKNHATVHSSERNFTCHKCGKCFARPGYLRTHQKVHSEERPHECPQCFMRFWQKMDLKRHLGIHKKDAVFKCTLCQKAYRRKDSLVNHLRKCHKQPKEAAKKLSNEGVARVASLDGDGHKRTVRKLKR